ncbi:hypothetical protein [Aeromonas bestiarum]|uniref:hypothetical protein n=1 Tax=Aeromonas bestiarum TaxID=105751 RepID=UPI000AE990DC|nr:hypothetical protein [Aeromonas bestiarum]
MPSKALILLPMDLDLHLPLALTLRQHTSQPWVGGDDRLTEPPSRRRPPHCNTMFPTHFRLSLPSLYQRYTGVRHDG